MSATQRHSMNTAVDAHLNGRNVPIRAKRLSPSGTVVLSFGDYEEAQINIYLDEASAKRIVCEVLGIYPGLVLGSLSGAAA